MAAASETEIKLLASPAMFAHLRDGSALTGLTRTHALRTTYFDSAERALAKSGLALRVRQQAHSYEQTAKAEDPTGGALRRGEWTAEIGDEHLRLDAFPPRISAKIRKALGDAEPVPVATNHIDRLTRELHHGGSTIEVAFDVGAIKSGSRSEDVCEVELELLRGETADLLALARTLPIGPELRWSVLGKGERGELLARGVAPTAVHARDLRLDADLDLATAFARIAWNCLDHLLANYLLVIETGDDEAIHQCRVAMRRLLAAWTVFGIADTALPMLRAGIKAAAQGLGRSRDLHILHQRLRDSITDDDREAATVLARIGEHQAEATVAAQAALASASFQTLLFDLATWIETGAWRDDLADRRLGPFARKLLARLQRKLHPGGKPLAKMSSEALHTLRKRGKQLRYAEKFFESLDGLYRKRTVRALARLQDELGEIHDLDVAPINADALLSEHDPIAAATAVARYGQLLAPALAHRKQRVKSAQKVLRKVQKATFAG